MKQKKAKIVLIANNSSSFMSFKGDLIKSLVENDFDVKVLAPFGDETIDSSLKKIGASLSCYSLDRAGMNPINDIKSIFQLLSLIRREKPDVLIASMLKPIVYGLSAAKFLGIRHRFAMIEGLGYGFTLQKNPSWRRKLLRIILKSMYQYSLRGVSQVFFMNRDDIAQFIEENIVSSHQAINLGGIGVPLDVWEEVPLVTSPVTFLMASRLLIDKGVRDYISAARMVKRLHPETRFLLIGARDENPASVPEEEAAGWVAEKVVEWPGHVSMKEWTAESSVFVLPSYREGLPRTTQEAMAMGRPVISTDAPGCRDTVIEGINGYLVPIAAPEQLATAMIRFIENPGLIHEMGANSRRLAEERYDVNRINARIVSCIKRAM